MIRGAAELVEVAGQGRLIVAARDLPEGTLVHASLPYAFAPVNLGGVGTATCNKRCLCCLSPHPPPFGSGPPSSSSSFIPCPGNCTEGYCSPPCKTRYETHHQSTGECAAWPLIQEACLNKSDRLIGWVNIMTLIFARAWSEKKSQVEGRLEKVVVADSEEWSDSAYQEKQYEESDEDYTTRLRNAQSLLLFPSGDIPEWVPPAATPLPKDDEPEEENEGKDTVIDDEMYAFVGATSKGSNNKRKNTKGKKGKRKVNNDRIPLPPHMLSQQQDDTTSSTMPKALQRLSRYASMPLELVEPKGARSMSDAGVLDCTMGGDDLQQQKKWIKRLWTRGEAYSSELLDKIPLQWADLCSLVGNTSVMEKDVLSIYSQAFRVYVKMQQRAPETLPFVTENMFIRACSGVKCNSFDYSGVKGEKSGCAVLPWSSYFNHSCAPNLVCPNNGKVMSCYTAAPVKKGEPLCISYLDISMPATDRRPSLARNFLFWCECSRCTGDAVHKEPPPCPCGNGNLRLLTDFEVDARELTVAGEGGKDSERRECTTCGAVV